MQQFLKDAAGPGTAFWLLGYVLSLFLYTTPCAPNMGWILLMVCTPITVAVTWWWFRERDLPLEYFAKVGAAWLAIAVVLDYLFIVLLLQATYYGADVFVYYALTFLIPVGVGLYLNRGRMGPVAGQG